MGGGVSRRTILVGMATAASTPTRLYASDALAEFYHGKSIRFLIGAAAAGGYDVVGRAVASVLGSHIPGKPTVAVENMPGASSLVMMNYFYNSAPRDGTVIGMPNNAILLEPRLRTLARSGSNERFDLAKLNWIGSPVQDPLVLWTVSTAASTFEDLKTKQVIMGATTPDADDGAWPNILNHVFGTKMKVVTGYQGQNDIFIAVDRGELQGNACGHTDLVTEKSDWLRSGKIKILIQFGASRLPSLPDVPTAIELASEADRDLFKFEALKYAATRPIAAPPNVPNEHVRALRSAFAAAMRDPVYVAEAEKMGLAINPVGGPEIESLISKAEATPQSTIDRLRSYLRAPS